MRDKKKEPATRKPADSKRKDDQTKRQLNSKIREIRSQESLLLFLFVESQQNIVSEPMIELVWEFMEFLKANGYHTISEKKVFCFPFGRMAELSKLK